MKNSSLPLFIGLIGTCLGVASVGGRQHGGPKVLLFLSTDCPIAASYTPRINALVKKFADKGVSFKAYFPNDLETAPGVQVYMTERGYSFPAAIDLGAQEAKAEGVRITPSAVVTDADGHKLYEGAIDDNTDATLARKPYLEEAIEAALANHKPPAAHIDATGCVLMPSKSPPLLGKVTYADHVRSIIDKHCTECHRPGEVAPFSLIGFQNAHKWAPMIARVATSRQMPPWKAVHGFGDFAEENQLSEYEIETLKRWDAGGAASGHLKEAADPIVQPTSKQWPAGEPDLVVSASKPFKLDGNGDDVYRNFVVKTDYPETRYVTGMSVKPGNTKIVHHVILFVDTSSSAAKLAANQNDGQEGYTSFGGPGFFPDTSFGGWVPGTRFKFAPEGTGFELKKGASVVLQIHYHKDGKPEEDQTRVGLYFSKKAVRQVMNLAWMLNPSISIPAGDAHHQETLRWHVPRDVTLYGLLPHMHLLGQSMKAEAILPDGKVMPLLYVRNWDFNWQLHYQFKEPVHLPKGTIVQAEAVYDNSSGNPKNPSNPPRNVTWGEQTTDEMCLLVGAYTIDGKYVAQESLQTAKSGPTR